MYSQNYKPPSQVPRKHMHYKLPQLTGYTMPHKPPRIVGTHQQRNSWSHYTRNKRNQPSAGQLPHTSRCSSISPCRHVLTLYIHTGNSTQEEIRTLTTRTYGNTTMQVPTRPGRLEATTKGHLDSKRKKRAIHESQMGTIPRGRGQQCLPGTGPQPFPLLFPH
jgi:hypothetical protein